MNYYLSNNFALKWLEDTCLYDLKNDELYELDEEAFDFLKDCKSQEGCNIEQINQDFLHFCLSEHILTKEAYSRKTVPLIKSPIPSLRYLELQITDKCNLKCKHCFVGKSQNNELPIAIIEKILDEFLQMQGLRVMITGGEPLMHRGFERLNMILPKYACRKVLFTNGLLLNSQILKNLNVDEIQFSIDGMERGHDALRGKGTFLSVIEKLQNAKEIGFPVSVATVVHCDNLDEFDEMETFFKEIGIKDWTVDIPSPVGNLLDNPSFQVPPHIAGRYLNYGFGDNYHSSAEGFACGLHLLSVLAGGAIAKCAFYCAVPIGHIEEGLRKVWGRLKPVNLKELECFDISCPVINSCRGGCRYRASTACNEKGENYKRDIYKCLAHGIIKHE